MSETPSPGLTHTMPYTVPKDRTTPARRRPLRPLQEPHRPTHRRNPLVTQPVFDSHLQALGPTYVDVTQIPSDHLEAAMLSALMDGGPVIGVGTSGM